MPSPFSSLFAPQPFPELRERLLRAGIAPRHVRRYLSELSDHLADLTAAEQAAGLSLPDARSAALARLGTTDTLADAMTSQPHAQSLTARAPWAVIGLAPVALLAAAYTIILLVLWIGWGIFLPHSRTPFVPVHGLAEIYFSLDRFLYYAAPMLIGWTIALIAARQRLSPAWPIAGLALLAALSTTTQVTYSAASATAANAVGHIRMNFALIPTIPNLVTGIIRILIVLSILMLPYIAEQLRPHQPA